MKYTPIPVPSDLMSQFRITRTPTEPTENVELTTNRWDPDATSRNWQLLNSTTPPGDTTPPSETVRWNVHPIASTEALRPTVLDRLRFDETTAPRSTMELFCDRLRETDKVVMVAFSMEFTVLNKLPPESITEDCGRHD